mmetsp:Transcript_2521/g.8623  ORF Transcript_2521/g.8623 Transcript_2521/m.8623 type:complete len:238 (+) Transcript_2521:709-1422(+)
MRKDASGTMTICAKETCRLIRDVTTVERYMCHGTGRKTTATRYGIVVNVSMSTNGIGAPVWYVPHASSWNHIESVDGESASLDPVSSTSRHWKPIVAIADAPDSRKSRQMNAERRFRFASDTCGFGLIISMPRALADDAPARVDGVSSPGEAAVEVAMVPMERASDEPPDRNGEGPVIPPGVVESPRNPPGSANPSSPSRPGRLAAPCHACANVQPATAKNPRAAVMLHTTPAVDAA